MALRTRAFSYISFPSTRCSYRTKLDPSTGAHGGDYVYCIYYEGNYFPFSFDRVPNPSIVYKPTIDTLESLSRRISQTTLDLMIVDILERGLVWLYREFEHNNDNCCAWTNGTHYDVWMKKNNIEGFYKGAYNQTLLNNSKSTNERTKKTYPRWGDTSIPRAPKPSGYSGPMTGQSIPADPIYASKTQEPVKPTQGGSAVSDEATLKALKDLKGSIDSLKRPTLLEESLIEAVVAKTKEIATKELEMELQKNLDKFIADKYGMLPKQIQVTVNKDHTATLTGLFHDKFNDILTMIANDVPVMVTGPAGSGKNFTLEQVAGALDLPFYYTGAITQEYKLTGFIDAGGHFHETEFYKAFKDGGLFMLDEVDASSPETLVILNGAIANRYFDFPTGRILAHPNFRIACAGNTFGTGADMIYVGRNVLDGATLDRFVVIKMDYDTDVEQKLCPDKDLFQFVLALRKTVDKMKLRHIVGMRASINGYKALEAGMSKAFIVESVILKGLSVDDIVVLRKNLVSSIPSAWKQELDNYSNRMETSR